MIPPVRARRLLPLVLLAPLVLGSCVSRRIRVPPFVPPAREASLDELVERINRRGALRTLTASAELQFETAEGAEIGVWRRYRTAKGRLLVARPRRIRLQIAAPLLGVSIAEMASDGRRFQLLMYPEEYRALVVGSNEADYSVQATRLAADPNLQRAGPLVNIRPQHFTSAFLFDPIDPSDPETIVLMKEERRLEDDDRPGALADEKIVRSYYVLTVGRRARWAPEHEYWFDRSRNLALARHRLFDDRGRIVGDVEYRDHLPIDPATGVRLAAEIYIERPYDEYALRITIEPASLRINEDIPDAAFSLEVPADWGEVRRIDLDRIGTTTGAGRVSSSRRTARGETVRAARPGRRRESPSTRSGR